ncbi:bifunctional glutamate N-acetyltransferase/amino-acid acetyltransferase ArgJ [bacterium]|nr:bifunctional glutamate N-acetyltransferase/amino-acid acetyltransferase ArgJ [bacterium]
MSTNFASSLPLEFDVAGVSCGIKATAGKRDMALFFSQRPCVSAGVFTTNKVCGAPVQLSRSRLPGDQIRGVVINSGNANACTGQQGLDDAAEMTALVAEKLGVAADSILVCSTGIIGHHLPMEKVRAGIADASGQLGKSPEHVESAARAMMTTDTYPKQITREIQLETGSVTLTGFAKGAAMIAPNMATMLSVVMTDLELTVEQADELIHTAVNQSFNCISVDGHTSTSDSVVLLANGASDVRLEDRGDVAAFQAALNTFSQELSHMIIRDAEGADHFITVDVEGARNFDEAEAIARTVANDMLVKAAVAGNDPNWGRIVSACGRTGFVDTAKDISLAINNYAVFKNGAPVAHDEETISTSMKNGDVQFDITLPYGQGRWRIWTSDLTQEYVRLNSEYTT